MYYFHLWIKLCESTEESDCGQLDAKAQGLQSVVREKLRLIRAPDECVCYINYSYVFQCSGGANHLGENHSNLLEVLRYLVGKLPGSHGIVYWSDDEDPTFHNDYRVIVIARGEIYDRSDPFLSPRNPTVED
jgi:hypothetical protein